jgi:hypothetical protein
VAATTVFGSDCEADMTVVSIVYYIEQVNDLTGDETQERWFTTEQVEEMDSECKADVYLIDHGGDNAIQVEG